MAEQSIYQEFIKQNLKAVSLGVATTYNGKDSQPSYLFKQLLKKKRAYDGRWTSTSRNIGYVMADYISTNSAIPQKSRDGGEVASGKIQKMATERWLDEEQLQLLANMRDNPNVTQDEIGSILFQDVQAVISGANERLEDTFLTGASYGKSLIHTDNVGLAVQMNYGYKNENKLGVPIVWSDPTADRINDLERAVSKVKGNKHMMLDRVALKEVLADEKARVYFGWMSKFFGEADNIPTLDEEAALSVIKTKFKLNSIQIVDRDTVYEIDGVRHEKTPWKEGVIGLYPSSQIGVLAWNKLAEAADPVQYVDYATVDEYLLISMWREKRSFYSQFTNSQGLVVPVIENGDKVVTLDTKTVQA